MTSPMGGEGPGAPPTDPAPDAGAELAVVGRVRKAHGIRGELVVEPFTNEPAAVFAAGRRLFWGTPDGRPLPARTASAASRAIVEQVAPPPAHRASAAPPASPPTAAPTPIAPRGETVVRRATPFKGGGWIVALSGLDDRSTAEQCRERTLLAPFAELPPPADDEVYLHDLVGMEVALVDGTAVGRIGNYFELPHALLLEVVRGTETVLVPYTPDIVKEVDTTARRVTIDPPEGLLE